MGCVFFGFRDAEHTGGLIRVKPLARFRAQVARVYHAVHQRRGDVARVLELFVHRERDRAVDVQPLDVEQAHGAHPVAEAEPHARVQVRGVGVARFDQADAVVLEGHEEVVDHEARPVLDRDGRLADLLQKGVRRGCGLIAREQAGGDFHEPVERGRQAEMGADCPGGPPRRRPHVGDGERARVGRDDGAFAQDGVQAPEELVLLLAVFGDGLDHQVAIPESRERPGLRDPAQHRVPLLGRGLSLLHTCVQESAHPAHPCLHGLRVRLEHGRLLAAPGAYDGDVRTHRPQTDDAYLINLHGILPSFFMSEARFPAWILAVSDRIFSMKFLRRGAVAHLQSVRTWVSL